MTAAALPAVDEILAAAVVVSLPMRVRFRGITERELVLVRGPARTACVPPGATAYDLFWTESAAVTEHVYRDGFHLVDHELHPDHDDD